jgi:hypothetical protein
MSKMSQLDQQLREIVFANLAAASENGYFEPGEYCHGMTAEELADDMAMNAPDVENYTAEQLLPYIREWMDEPKDGMPFGGQSL